MIRRTNTYLISFCSFPVPVLLIVSLMSHFSLPVTVSRYPDGKDKVKVLYIRIVSPFPEMERFLQDTTKR